MQEWERRRLCLPLLLPPYRFLYPDQINGPSPLTAFSKVLDHPLDSSLRCKKSRRNSSQWASPWSVATCEALRVPRPPPANVQTSSHIPCFTTNSNRVSLTPLTTNPRTFEKISFANSALAVQKVRKSDPNFKDFARKQKLYSTHYDARRHFRKTIKRSCKIGISAPMSQHVYSTEGIDHHSSTETPSWLLTRYRTQSKVPSRKRGVSSV